MEWGYLIRLPKNTYKYILLYPAHMFLTVGMTDLGNKGSRSGTP